MFDLIIRDATLVSSSGRLVADVAIKGGKIKYVGPRPPRPGREEILAMGKFLMPGVIDTAVQFSPNGDPSIWERESRAAVTGGVTTVLELPGGEHPVTDRASARARHEAAAGRSWVNWGLWGAAREDNVAELAKALEEGLITATLAHLGGSGVAGKIPAQKLADFLSTSGTVGVQLDVPEDGSSAEPPGARELIEALRTDRPIHLVHLSTAAELNLLDPVRGDLPVTAGCTPHHLFLSRDEIQTKTVPPMRPEHDRRTLWTAVKRGRLDCVASDHHPSNGNADGVPGTELLFPLMLSAVRYGRLSLELLVGLCSESPARIFGLENKGRIEKGADADLVLFSEGEVTRVDEKVLLSGAGWSPYADREAAPKPDLVLVNGVVVARHGELVASQPCGTRIAES